MCFFFFNILFIFFSIRVYHRILNTVPCVIQWDLAVSVHFSHSVVSNCLWPHGLQYIKFPCPSPTPGACSNSCPSSRWCHPTNLILCRPLLLLPSVFPSIRVFSNESGLHIRWPEYESFSFSINPSNEYSGLISFRMDCFDLLLLSILYIIVCAWVLSCFSLVQLCATLWTVAHQALLSMGVSRQEYWSGLPCPPPGDLPDPGIKPESLMSPALAGRFFTASTTWEASLQLLISNCQSFSTPQPSLVDVWFLIQVKSWAVEELHFSTYRHLGPWEPSWWTRSLLSLEEQPT